ncbi:hypothetical protein [Streptomyces sp. YS415]|uniref:DUF6924 domain-containing protein n=1 Tax=Streptomyces sp. YS415 TaxID=2944806 RepID=UPI00201FCBFB|nr:hypothetical protein [Streptomyces sp. YS415]MCL7429368.1 hypothetical protein [Streptomyces sp. YS415]
MVSLSEVSQCNEYAAVIVRTDFTDEIAWRQVVEELDRSALDDDPAKAYSVIDAPELGDSDTDTVLAAIEANETLRDTLSVVFVADGTTMRSGLRALLALTTVSWDDTDDEALDDEYGTEFRTVPGGVHEIHANLTVGNMGFDEFASSAEEDPDGVYRPTV